MFLCWSYGVKAQPQVMWIEFWYQTHKSHHRIFLRNLQKNLKLMLLLCGGHFSVTMGMEKFFYVCMCLFLLFPHFTIGKIWKALQMQDVAFQLFFFKFLLDDIPCGSKLCSEKAPKKLRQKTYWIPMCPPLKFSILSSCWLPHKDGTFGGPHHCHD